MNFFILLSFFVVFSFSSCTDFSFPVHPENSKNINFSKQKNGCNIKRFDYSNENFLTDFTECVFLNYGYQGSHSDEITFFLDQNVGLQGSPALIKADYGKRLDFQREFKTKEEILMIKDSFEIYYFSSLENMNFANEQLMKWERLNQIFIPLKFFNEEKRILLIGKNNDPSFISKDIKSLIKD